MHLRKGISPYKLNFENPKTFNDHINHIKLYKKNELGAVVADKVKVRDYVKEKIGEKYLIPIYGVFSNANEIAFNSLPNGFALKLNHGSGWNIICKDKDKLDIKQTTKKLNFWKNLNAYYLSREWQYKDIKPLIICEKLLEYDIFDYKFFCFNSIPKFLQIDINRFTNHKRLFFDSNWTPQNFSISYQKFDGKIEKPLLFDEMLEIAKKLAFGFDFVRVDLYIYQEKVYFGELTLHPGGGFEPFLSYEHDLEIGSYFIKN